MNTPTFVNISDSNSGLGNEESSLRSCFRSSASLTSESRHVRLAEDARVHLPPVQLVETLQNVEERRSIWYNGNDIRRMKQSCVSVISKLDAKQPVPQAVESDWLGGTTSVRGLEFGTREGQQRKRVSLQYQRIVLQEQARLRQEAQQEPHAVETALAATAQEASRASTQLAQDLAIQDASFICEYVENVHSDNYPRAITRRRRSPAVVAWVRRWYRAAKQARRAQTHMASKKMLEDGRPRCDTESTFTIMVCSS